MRASPDEAAFLEYKRAPSPDKLAALLTSVQDRVYNICFQILRRTEDAEDACQEVLIELTRGLSKIDAPRPFKVWLYRVAVHTALDRKESRDRRARLAPKAVKPEGLPMDESERAELMRALGTLDDRTRCLVLEHYFDKVTLEEIGAREGVSAVAIFKRLDRARETLRRALLGAGFTVAAAGVAQALESVSPVVAPAGFVIKPAAIAAGGAIVAMKSTVTAGSIVAALVIAGAAATGGYALGASRPRPEIAKSQPGRIVDSVPTVDPGPRIVSEEVSPPAPKPASLKSAGPREEDYPKEKSGHYDPSTDTSPVKYGRYGRARVTALLNAATWDEFYKTARDQEVGSATFEDLVFQRVMKELGIEAGDAQTLRELFESEREKATQYIVENAGGAALFQQSLKDLTDQRKDDWRRQRDVVRETFRLEYLKLLTFDQLQIFNDHLRNSEIAFEGAYSGEGRHFLIMGVGKKPK